MWKQKQAKCNLCFTQGAKANEKMGLIAEGMRCGNYIKTDNTFMHQAPFPVQHISNTP